MALELCRLEVGPWPMNCYLVRCLTDGQVAIVDPGADARTILTAVGEVDVCCILLTHAHPDHVGALRQVHAATGVPLGVHPADAGLAQDLLPGLEVDFPLLDGMKIEIGKGHIKVAHAPGHTAGSVCLRLEGTGSRLTYPKAVVGDAIFPGGPGHTASPADLAQSLASLGQTVFTWPDATELHPGHGEHTTVGAERQAFEEFVAQTPPPGLCGDVSWR